MSETTDGLGPVRVGVIPASILAWVLAATTGCASRPSVDREAETAAVRSAIESSIDWAKTKDLARLYGVIADDSSYLEVHPDGRVVKSFAEFNRQEAIWMSPAFRAIRHEDPGCQDQPLTLG